MQLIQLIFEGPLYILLYLLNTKNYIGYLMLLAWLLKIMYRERNRLILCMGIVFGFVHLEININLSRTSKKM